MTDSNPSRRVPFLRKFSPGTAVPPLAPGLAVAEADKAAFAYHDAAGRVSLLLRAAQQVDAGLGPRDGLRDLPESARDIYEKVLERSNLLPEWFLSVGAARARCVCKITVADSVDYHGERGSWAGSGFLVAPDILLTNHHVLNSSAAAQRATCIFDYTEGEDGTPLVPRRFTLDPAQMFVTSKTDGGLDFTFVAIVGEPGREYGHVSLGRGVTVIADHESANIIQHPGGEFKQVAVQDNTVVKQDQVVLHYTTDSQPGSSGSPVFNNEWKVVALHHASPENPAGLPVAGGTTRYLNEGIKPSAIASHLESLIESSPDARERENARRLVALFRGSDELAGYFGSMGRDRGRGTDVEKIVNAYRGEAQDVDVGFWNVEWFNTRLEEKLDRVAAIVLAMNLDVWAFEESSPEAAARLVELINRKAGQAFAWAASEPGAPSTKQTTTVIWNTNTVEGQRRDWPAEIHGWFEVHSEDFDDLGLEAVEGPIFPRYPGLFSLRARRPAGAEPFDFYLVPLHLKAMAEGSKRRRMAAAILAHAIERMISEHGADPDWIVGGDLNAPLASGDFQRLLDGATVAMSARDESEGAISYIKGPRSMIDHVFLSPNLTRTHGPDDFFIVARDQEVPDYVSAVSDHRPVLVRLSLGSGRGRTPRRARALPEELKRVLARLDRPYPSAPNSHAPVATR